MARKDGTLNCRNVRIDALYASVFKEDICVSKGISHGLWIMAVNCRWHLKKNFAEEMFEIN